MKRLFYLFVLALFASLFMHAQRRVRVASYNVENLFDTLHDEGRNDYDFLPTGKYRWNSYRYWEKLHSISRVITAMGEDASVPILVGLCEVENDSCLRDLTKRSALRHLGYEYVITHGPDERGVETALLYQSAFFHLVDSRGVRVPSAEHGLRPTRDILLVRGTLFNGDTLHVAVVHFPSRAGGSRKSELNRMLAAKCLRNLADSLDGKKLLVMGDFNAEPGDVIFKQFDKQLRSLVTQDRRRLRGEEGTYVYKNLWGYLDHIFVTPELLPMMGAETIPFKNQLFLDVKGYPKRCFRGPIYQKGFSDHLPIMVEMILP